MRCFRNSGTRGEIFRALSRMVCLRGFSGDCSRLLLSSFGDKCAIFVMPNDEQQEIKTLDRGSVVRSDLILASVYDSRRSEIGTW